MNSYLEASVTYEMTEPVIVDRSLIGTWITVDQNMGVVFQTDLIKAWLEEFGNKYDTVGATRTFTTPDGRATQVSGGTYGWSIDEETELTNLKNDIKNKAIVTRQPAYYVGGMAAAHAMPDWGGTYIETWTSKEALATMPDMQKKLDVLKELPISSEDREKKFHSDVEDWKKEIEKIDKGFVDGRAIWTVTDFEDSAWKTMRVPGLMQEQGLKGFNGIVWFRKTIDIPAKWEGKELTLNVGVIDDNDFTYFNGVQVGHTEGWMSPRSYKIPKELVKSGKAVIAVRVMDTGGTGGINGSPESISLHRSQLDAIPLAGDWKYQISLNIKDIPQMPVNTANEPNIPGFLFNAMLNPLIPYSIKGAIWYQGEANTGQAYQYRELMPLMIKDWRDRWGYDFPFYMVQLASFTAQQTAPVDATWAELREAQTRTLHLANTGMAVTIDIGDAFDIHPKNKQEVGRRLALAARAQTYGEKIPYSGPMYDTYQMEGNKIRIYFKHTDGRLKTANNEVIKGFTIAGVDHKFHWADAVIEGNTIVVSSPEVAFPIAVRYAWADNPICNLYNGANLPASPFRTDDWPGITFDNK